MDSNKDPIEKLREHARKVSDMATELSEHGFSPLGLQLEAIANEIEAQYLRPPVDADGVPIRPGDKMQMALGESAEVVAVGSDRWFYDQSCLADDGEEYDWDWAENSRHVKTETVEGIVAEVMSLAREPEAHYSKNSSLVRAYAERIRKAVEK